MNNYFDKTFDSSFLNIFLACPTPIFFECPTPNNNLNLYLPSQSLLDCYPDKVRMGDNHGTGN